MAIARKKQGKEIFYGGNTNPENNATMALVNAAELDTLEGDYAVLADRVKVLEKALRRITGEAYGIYKSAMDVVCPGEEL